MQTIYSAEENIFEQISTSAGEVIIYTQKCPDKTTNNEDAIGIFIDKNRGALIVADGMGGAPLGDKASELVIKSISSQLKSKLDNTDNRAQILDGIEKANNKILELKVGAGSTCAVIEIAKNEVRPYHVGDSSILICGQRGKIKFQSIQHSPVGYALESGVIDEEEALHHQFRHEISNYVGSPEMSIDIGPTIPIGLHDTVLLGTDGLFDNLRNDEIVNIIRKGDLEKTGYQLAEAVRIRMKDSTENSNTGLTKSDPSKPDDVAFILYRRKR